MGRERVPELRAYGKSRITIKTKIMKLRIDEAIAKAQLNGKKVFKKDLADKIFASEKESTRQVNMTNLCTGKTKRVSPEWVKIICEECGCTANFLFGLED